MFPYEIDSLHDVTSVNFKSKKVHEDIISGQQDIYFSEVSKNYKYVKSPLRIGALTGLNNVELASMNNAAQQW